MLGFASLAVLSVLGLANGQSNIGFGPAFSLGPTQSWIREAKTTLVLPEVPSAQADRLALWPGMGTSSGDLIQALAVSFSDPAANCGASEGQWCTWASTLQGKTGDGQNAHWTVDTDYARTEQQLGGKEAPVSAGDDIVMHYKYNDNTGKYDQTVSINGEVVSSLSTSSGHAQGWGTAVECQDSACQSSVAAHKYKSTTIILDSADNSFGDTLSLTEADSSGLKTTDNGKTWKVSTINIQAHTYNL